MKQFFYKILSFSLALIVLLSSFSFTVNKHICGGKVSSVSLFVNADNCGMDMLVCKNENSKKQTSIKKESCCKDVSELIQGNDNNQQAQQFHLNIPQMEFLTAYVYTFIAKFQETTTVSSIIMYKPPLVYKNIQTLFQVFRI